MKRKKGLGREEVEKANGLKQQGRTKNESDESVRYVYDGSTVQGVPAWLTQSANQG